MVGSVVVVVGGSLVVAGIVGVGVVVPVTVGVAGAVRAVAAACVVLVVVVGAEDGELLGVELIDAVALSGVGTDSPVMKMGSAAPAAVPGGGSGNGLAVMPTKNRAATAPPIMAPTARRPCPLSWASTTLAYRLRRPVVKATRRGTQDRDQIDDRRETPARYRRHESFS